MKKKNLLLPFALIFQVACGGSYAPEPAAAESAGSADTAGADYPSAPTVEGTIVTSDGSSEWEELLGHDDSLEETLQLSDVDCPAAHDLVESICALAERVCGIAEDTADGETEERCVDGRSRCERAQDRTGNVCP